MLGASSSGQLARNEKQVANVRGKGKMSSLTNSGAIDDLFVIMQEAHTQDPQHKFVRDIKTSPEPAVVLANDQQLQELVNFGTSSSEFGIVTIDPTFTLGAFDVTPVTYRHLLLETRRNKQPPIMLGPILIHYRKSFVTYFVFASSLIGLKRSLEGIRAFGTDDDQTLIDAFNHVIEFGFSQHLTCFVHVRRNIKEKLNNCNLPPEISKLVLNDIFGRRFRTVFEEGLVDSDDNDDFQVQLQAILKKWRSSEISSSADMDGFIHWFMANKVDVIQNTMLRPIRVECGLGNPPEIFTTNPSEMHCSKTKWNTSRMNCLCSSKKSRSW